MILETIPTLSINVVAATERIRMQFSAKDIDELATILADSDISFSNLHLQQAALAVVKYVLCKELLKAKQAFDEVANYE